VGAEHATAVHDTGQRRLGNEHRARRPHRRPARRPPGP
jgi:hypothetical protein